MLAGAGGSPPGGDAVVRGDDDPVSAAEIRAEGLLATRDADRFSVALISVVSLGYGATTYVGILQYAGGLHAAAGTLYAVGIVALQLGYFSRPGAVLTPGRSAIAMVVLAGLTYLPMFQLGTYWGAYSCFLAGCVLIALPLRWGLAAYLLVVIGSGLIERRFGDELLQPVFAVVYSVVATAITGLVLFGLTRLARVVRELNEAREELSRMAVAEERLRFRRDAHDLLGMSLSAIALKAELVHRLMVAEPTEARTELAEVIATSRRALGEVRMVAAGYTTLSLREELASARSVLGAAEIDTSVTGLGIDLPDDAGSLFATLVREAATNILRHSKADVCHIAVSRDADSARIAITNDGAREDEDPSDERPAEARRGTVNLRARFAERGGELHVHRDADEYTIVGVLPVSARDGDGAGR